MTDDKKLSRFIAEDTTLLVREFSKANEGDGHKPAPSGLIYRLKLIQHRRNLVMTGMAMISTVLCIGVLLMQNQNLQEGSLVLLVLGVLVFAGIFTGVHDPDY